MLLLKCLNYQLIYSISIAVFRSSKGPRIHQGRAPEVEVGHSGDGVQGGWHKAERDVFVNTFHHFIDSWFIYVMELDFKLFVFIYILIHFIDICYGNMMFNLFHDIFQVAFHHGKWENPWISIPRKHLSFPCFWTRNKTKDWSKHANMVDSCHSGLANKTLQTKICDPGTSKNHQKPHIPNRDFPFLINFPLGTCQTSSSTNRKKGVSNPRCEFLNSPSCMQSAPLVSRIRQGHTLGERDFQLLPKARQHQQLRVTANHKRSLFVHRSYMCNSWFWPVPSLPNGHTACTIEVFHASPTVQNPLDIT